MPARLQLVPLVRASRVRRAELRRKDQAPMTDSLFDDHGGPTHRARSDDPPTSHAAAASIDEREGTARELRPGTHTARMLDARVRAQRPLADYEAAQLAGLYVPHVCYWHRDSDLLAREYIRDTGTTVLHPATRRRKRVCEVTEAGMVEWRRLREQGS